MAAGGVRLERRRGEGATARHRDECQAAHNGEDDSFPGHESMVQVRHKLRIMTR
jgi:hypothetical protein